MATEAGKWEILGATLLRPFTLCPPRHETVYCRDVGWGRWFLLPFREGEEGGGLRPKGSVAAGAAGAPAGFALFDLVFPQIEPRSGPPMASAMLPGKVEKRMASSVFITLVPPRREVATKDKPHREPQPDGAEVPSSRHPRSPAPRPPALPNGGEGCTWRGREDDDGAEDAAEISCYRMCVQVGGNVGFGGVIPQIPAPRPRWIRLRGRAVFALHC